MKTQRNGGSGRDSGGDDSDSGHSGGSASTGSGSPEIRHEENHETYPVARFTDLHTDSTPEDMRELFRGVGRIKEFCMFHDRNGDFMGEAEVAYQRNSNAHKAVRELNNKDFRGKPLTVTIVEVFGSQRGSSRTDTSPADSESEPETGKGEGKKRKKSSDEEEDDPDSEKATKQPRGIKIG